MKRSNIPASRFSQPGFVVERLKAGYVHAYGEELLPSLTRSFGRWRRRERLWGTNQERFLPHLKVWDEEASLVAWAVRHHAARKNDFQHAMADPQWAHLEFVRFTSNSAAMKWVASLQTPR
jgi:hypothetical protein